MKILQLIYESFGSPYGFGGAGVRAYEIYKRLKERHDITLLCMKYPGARDREIGGLRHIFVGMESKSLTKSVVSYTLKAGHFVKEHGDTFEILIENFLPSTPFFSRFLTKTPVILQIQGIMEKHSLRKFHPFYSIPMYLVERYYPGLYDKFIFVSDITKEKIMKRVNKKINLSEVIPNGVDASLLEVAPGDEDYLLFFSRIDIYTKGIDLLVKAFERLISEYPHLRLILAGYEFDRFDKFISVFSPSLKKRVEYARFVTGEEKINLLSKAKLFILPSRHESSPISILEAAACGKPVIVSDIAELRFVEENNFGMSFPSGSVSGLQERIELLLRNCEMRHYLGMKGREYAKKFLWDGIALQYEKLLNSL